MKRSLEDFINTTKLPYKENDIIRKNGNDWKVIAIQVISEGTFSPKLVYRVERQTPHSTDYIDLEEAIQLKRDKNIDNLLS